MNDSPNLPASLTVNPRLDRWIKFEDDRTVRIASGKVEIGQGIITALAQIAAEELDVPLERIALLSGSTEHGPDERYTSLQSIDHGLRRVDPARLRRGSRTAYGASRFTAQLCTERFGYNRRCVRQRRRNHRTRLLGRRSSHRFQSSNGAAAPKSPSHYNVVGQDIPRADLPGKVTGATNTYLHDIQPDGCPARPDTAATRAAGNLGRTGRKTPCGAPAAIPIYASRAAPLCRLRQHRRAQSGSRCELCRGKCGMVRSPRLSRMRTRRRLAGRPTS